MIISLDNVYVSYKKKQRRVDVLENFSLHVQEGEFLCITGPSGSGKTTLLNLIAGLVKADSGKVRLFNRDLFSLKQTDLSEMRLKLFGFVFQNFYLFPRLNALDNVALPLYINGLKSREAQTKAKALLESLGCGHRCFHFPAELSVGEQQRVAIARALANNPPLIIADEPTGNLDMKNIENIFKIFENINKKKGKTIVLATHNKDLCQMCSRTISLN